MRAVQELSTSQRVGLEFVRGAAIVAMGASVLPSLINESQSDLSGAHTMTVGDETLASRASVTHPHSDMSPQTVLDDIHHYAVPGEAWKPNQKAWVRPTSAYVKPWAINFETDCGKNGGPGSWGNYYSFKYYTLDKTGLSYKYCAGNGLIPTAEDPGYSKQLHKLGDKIQTAVGLSTNEDATYVGGNRNKVVVNFNGTNTQGILKIIIFKGGQAEVDRG